MYNDCSSDLLPSTNQRAGNRLIQAEPGYRFSYFSFTDYKSLSLTQLERYRRTQYGGNAQNNQHMLPCCSSFMFMRLVHSVVQCSFCVL